MKYKFPRNNVTRCLYVASAVIAFPLAVGALVKPAWAQADRAAPASEISVTFDDLEIGGVPQGWRAEGANQAGAVATWTVTGDVTAPSSPNVLTLNDPNPGSHAVFNLFWTPSIQIKNGQIDLSVRANTGRVDQGGGPIWRVQDADNYYVARYNPLENNFRVYDVKNGRREQLASAENLKIASGRWYEIRIVHTGSHIEAWVDGEKRIDLDDKTFMQSGGVGFWTKADAATSFDDLIVHAADQALTP